MTKKKKLFIALGVCAALACLALVFVYVFVYDGFGLVERGLNWEAALPGDMVLDRSMDRLYVTGENDYLYMRISKERSPYLDVEYYIDYYFDRFHESPDWQAVNEATLLRDESDGKLKVTSLRFGRMPENLPDTYTYVTIRTDTQYFFRVLFKYDSDHRADEAEAAIERFLETFSITMDGIESADGRLDTDFHLVIPESWSEETREAFERLRNAETPYFGIFTEDYDAMEERLEHEFPVVLKYFHLNGQLPRAFMEGAYEQGKLTELTLQLTVTGNDALYTSPSILVDVLAGRYDEQLETIAEGLRAFGHPFLFRLNNEMNSDWTSYSGIINLSDPDLYVAAWRYIYTFFEERGVDNAIWVFNPNDQDFPPAKWNNFLAYYPGDGYVQIYGVTGYNTGNYYHDLTAEDWRDFTEIYDYIDSRSGEIFAEFPWIITEFGSSSYGGDKPGWIADMFEHIGDYDHIKAAVWFDYADFDYSKEEPVAARPYWIGETEESLEAFKEGFASTPERFFD